VDEQDPHRRAEAFARVESQVDVLARRLRRVLLHRSAELGEGVSPGGYLVLRHLIADGPSRQVDLVARFDSEKGAISRLVQHLVDAGLAERTPDPLDRRAQLVAATPDAVRRQGEVDARRREEYRARLHPMGTDELELLASLLNRYNEAAGCRPDAPAPG